MDYYYGWQVSVVVMGGHDWFQALASAVGILGVTSSDAGRDRQCCYMYCLEMTSMLFCILLLMGLQDSTSGA